MTFALYHDSDIWIEKWNKFAVYWRLIYASEAKQIWNIDWIFIELPSCLISDNLSISDFYDNTKLILNYLIKQCSYAPAKCYES